MSLYPSILFHFTEKDNLHEILESGAFKVSYAREQIKGGDKTKEFAVPMVSFSDLRLSEVKHNVGTYGKFGIGLKKEWAIYNKLNPVMYVSRYSNFTENFMSSINHLFEMVSEATYAPGKDQMAYNYIINTLRYIKNYQGDLIRPGQDIKKDYVFANEREWRYVPPITESIRSFVPIEKIRSKEQKLEFNKEANHIQLRFEPDNIQYLIVESNNDINNLMNHLKRLKRSFDPDIIDRLSSRVLTYEQIEKDV